MILGTMVTLENVEISAIKLECRVLVVFAAYFDQLMPSTLTASLDTVIAIIIALKSVIQELFNKQHHLYRM